MLMCTDVLAQHESVKGRLKGGACWLPSWLGSSAGKGCLRLVSCGMCVAASGWTWGGMRMCLEAVSMFTQL
jgi:hypothetical protein